MLFTNSEENINKHKLNLRRLTDFDFDLSPLASGVILGTD